MAHRDTLSSPTPSDSFNNSDYPNKSEDEVDLIVDKLAYQEYVADDRQSRPISALFQELNL